MIARFSRRDRRTVLAGAAGIMSIVGAGKGMPALRGLERDRVAAAAEARVQLQAAEAGAASLQDTRDSAAVREQRLSEAKADMIIAATPEAAAAALAAMTETIAEDEGVSIGTVTLRPDTTVRSGMARVGVRVTAEGDVEGLAGLLYELETHDTPMIVRELSVSQPDPAAPPNRAEVLRFELLLVTLARIDRDGPRRDRGRE